MNLKEIVHLSKFCVFIWQKHLYINLMSAFFHNKNNIVL